VKFLDTIRARREARKFLSNLEKAAEKGSPVEITCMEVKELMHNGGDFILLDVREQDEWDLVRLDGAVLCPMSDFLCDMEKLDNSKLIVAYCHRGIRSFQAMCILRNNGFPNVRNMTGGIDLYARTVDTDMKRY